MASFSAPAGAPPLILASSSRYRRELLERLRLPFSVQIPDIDESPADGETPRELAERLALEKAGLVASRNSDAVVIGSDQVVECDGRSLGKPGTRARAIEQLSTLQGRQITFHTALCVRDSQRSRQQIVPTVVRMRSLTTAQIERYVDLEPALDCAGAFRSEALGICLFERLQSDDPTALIGLPLIATVQLLDDFGITLP